jgi:hypothetical protein
MYNMRRNATRGLVSSAGHPVAVRAKPTLNIGLTTCRSIAGCTVAMDPEAEAAHHRRQMPADDRTFPAV